ncbi:putative TIM-barrel fold metal-dependent hydrolase [Luteibacter rhizovicinus]|uniref:Putative TIM-barrel fold metal-dependent hydrolase n=1 Tax=Luteibacter rhizovicinus TaxID=242606 RepID=A0A4R3Z142_9GAMM|nr:amidohydrolase family protein [Luteibacter rhizovicinus]TCV97463.1 putative TIM-barrel fold metal-dependent hydrolase [Luteibacter rhizovicinus]
MAGFCCAPPLGAPRRNQLSTAPDTEKASLPLSDFRPRSMLHLPATRVERPRFPVIDMHTHLTWTRDVRNGVSVGEDIDVFATPDALLPVMDRKGVKTLVNLTGGTGAGLESAIAQFDHAAPGRFLTLTEPSFGLFAEPDYPQHQAEAIDHAHRVGARGLKLLKTLGLYLREGVDEGELVTVDDARFDPMWEACAGYDMPVFLHISDPEAFFLPADATNERYEELAQHPDWSFYGPQFPGNAELLAARDRMIARHPRTTFALMHVGNHAEHLAEVARTLDRFPNTMVDISARIGELGRQPRAAQAFFDRYQDRIMFGTDAVPAPWGNEVPQQLFCDELYEIYYRFLETDDEYFDYAPADVPPQGRWSIYGLKLSDTILRKIYHDNAARLLGIAT